VGVALLCAAGVTVSVIARHSRVEAEGAFAYYFETHDKAGALKRIDDSRPLNPSFQLDIAEARLKPPAEGVQILTRTVHTEPENAEVWLRLAQQQVAAGDREAGRRSYLQARKLAPLFLPPDGPPPGT
jgi:predicted Zn-dependent protease